MKELQKQIDEVFTDTFGRTPLKERLDDILREAMDLHRHHDIRQLKEEAGDLLSSTLQLCSECDWDSEQLVAATLEKIQRRRAQYAALGRKIKVAVYGGAFDPPHIGHMAVIKLILHASRSFDEVWMMPCFKHMAGKRMSSPEHRLEMCRLAAGGDTRIKTCDYEIRRGLIGETYHVVKHLLEDLEMRDKYDFSLVIGLDNAQSFNDRMHAESLERAARFVVVARAGVSFDPQVNWFLRPPHMYLQAETPLPEISSTRVRELLHTGSNGARDFLGDAVFEYILQNGLYSA